MGADLIAAAVGRLLSLVGISGSAGISEEALSRFEREKGEAIPPEARRLLAMVSAKDWKAAVSSIRLCGLDEAEWNPEGGEEKVFMFAAGDYGDAILLDGAGQVLLADHESDEGTVMLETSLAKWIDRLADYDGVEYAYLMGELPKLDAAKARRFLERHVELNPKQEWGARELFKMTYPDGHPRGYHHFNRQAGRLVPIGEAGAVTDVTLKNGRQLDLESICRAGQCECLMIVGGEGFDFTVLKMLGRLAQLYVYDIAEVDARALGEVGGLESVVFLRCRVRGLEALGRLTKLKRLGLKECEFEEWELDVVKGTRKTAGLGRLGVER